MVAMWTAVDVSPAAARRMLWLRIGLFTAAILLGLLLNHLVQGHLAALERLAVADPIRARAALAREIRVGGLVVFGSVLALGLSLVPAALHAARTERFPPPGMWSWGATRVLTGPEARRAAHAGLVLGVLLAACAVAGGWLSWEMGARLLACHAGVAAAGD